MSLKFVALVAFFAVARAGIVPAPALAYSAANVVAPLAYSAPVHHVEASAPAHYDYGYSVSDPHTGDQKSQQESRRGDVVQGSYSLVDSDGTKRTVEYTADPHNGFNAVVHKEPVHSVAAKVVAAPAAVAYHAAPAAVSYAAPAPVAYHHAAPAAYSTYAAPASISYAAPAPVAYSTHSAPLVTKVSHAAPVYGYAAHSAPIVAKYAAAPATYAYAAPSPAIAYSAPHYYH